MKLPGGMGWLLGGLLLSSACTNRAEIFSRPGTAAPGQDAAAGTGPGGGAGATGSIAPASVPGLSLPDAGATTDAGAPDLAPAVMVPSVGPWGGQFVDPKLPAPIPANFVGPEQPVGGPTVVYPLAGSMHPTNLLDMTVMWRRGGADKDVYRLRFANERGRFDLFVPCAVAECIYPVPEEVWRQIAGTNRDRDVQLTITSAGAALGTLAVSAPVTLRFSPGRVEGGLYYWSTSLRGMYRLALGQKKAVPYISDPANQFSCHGCHVVSRNGKRIAWTDMTPSRSGSVSLPNSVLASASTDAPQIRVGGRGIASATMALDPEGTKVLVSDAQGGVILRDATTAAMISRFDPAVFGAGKATYFPEWSPDGKNIAFSVGRGIAASGTGRGFNLAEAEIAIVPFDNGAFGLPRLLVPRDGKEAHYYPTWSPDGRWIVFCSAPANPAGTYDNPQARLRLIAASGGPIYELGRATQGLGNAASWPKLTPFSQLGGQLLFVSFSSRVDYGFLAKNKLRPQLWLAAIDLRRLGEGDPSWAPVWLPFQDVTQNNHLPFWTEALGCKEDVDCGGGATCQAGTCVPNVID